MKRSFAIILIICLVLSMASSFALLPPKYTSEFNPFTLESIIVTNMTGYANPYLAVDNAALFDENQVVYVVIATKIKKKSVDDNIGTLVNGSRTITVTSSTLDLNDSKPTAKWFWKTMDGSVTETPNAPDWCLTKSQSEIVLTIPLVAGDQPTTDDYKMGYYSFIAVTKPATAGEVKAAMTVDTNKFADITPPYPVYAGYTLTKQAFIYNSSGLKYIIKENAAETVFVVYTRAADNTDTALFAYKTNSTKFEAILHDKSVASDKSASWNAAGRLIYVNSVDDKIDITDTVNAVNSYFGFSFVNSEYPILRKYFESKTAGSSVVVTDTYGYKVDTVTTADSDADIADTGDFSGNTAIVLMASTLLAVAAIAFVAKKAHN